jgi:hypothetical protein
VLDQDNNTSKNRRLIAEGIYIYGKYILVDFTGVLSVMVDRNT